MAEFSNAPAPSLSLVKATPQGYNHLSNNRKAASQRDLNGLLQMGMLAPHQIRTASITGNAAAMQNNSKNLNYMKVNGGRRRSRHAKKTRRNKRHSKKTRRNRKH